MKKSAFTLMEVVISVVLLSIIVLFMTDGISVLKKGYNQLLVMNQKSKLNDSFIELLYLDFVQAKQPIDIKMGKDFDLVNFQTNNTLYNYDYPYVSYLVIKKDNTLLRLESDSNITLPIEQDNLYKTKFLEIKKNLKEFHIYPSESKDLHLIYIKPQDEDSIILELSVINDLIKKSTN